MRIHDAPHKPRLEVVEQEQERVEDEERRQCGCRDT